MTARVADEGPSSISVVEIIVGNGTTDQVLQTNTISPPVGINTGETAIITCGGSCFTYPKDIVSSVWIKAITSLGSVDQVTYPTTTIVPQALVAGTVGYLLLNFSSYTYYNVTKTGCTTGSSYSGYCFSNGASASIVPVSSTVVLPSPNSDDTGCGDYDSDDPNGLCQSAAVAFSVQVTDLNPNEESIVLDQFTVLYQAPTALASSEAEVTPAAFVPWYIVSAQSSGGEMQILSQFSPIVLSYNVSTTIYFASINCVAASLGPNPSQASCSTLNSASYVSPNQQIQSPPSPAESDSPYLSTAAFVLTSGWEITGSVNVGSLTYAAANYGQDLPYLSTLFVSSPTLVIDPTSGPPLTVISLSSGIGYKANTAYSYCLSSSSTTVSCIAGTTGSFTTTAGGTIPTGKSLTVPSTALGGNYYVIVYTGTTVIAYSLFQVSVSLTINPTASSAPTTITMTGSGYGNAQVY